jgi:enoyl-CoA hydratase/carnithine racemase
VPTITRDGDVAVLNLGADENRFSPAWLESMHKCVDELEGLGSPAALVTVADGKFWSNGLDLDWLMSHTDQAEWYVDTVQRLLSRVLVAPMPTVAAIQGHCFAAGGILAMAHDWRVMRADRGFFCLPEADIRIPFTPGMTALIQAKLPVAAQTEAMLGAARFGGEAAAAADIVNRAVAEHAVVPTAVEIAAAQAPKDGGTLEAIKRGMYTGALAALADGGALRPA